MFAFAMMVEPEFDSVNAARKGALKSHIFGAPKAGDRWNAPVLCAKEDITAEDAKTVTKVIMV